MRGQRISADAVDRGKYTISYLFVYIGNNDQDPTRVLTLVEPEANALATRRHVKGCVGISSGVPLSLPIYSTNDFSSLTLRTSLSPKKRFERK
jgi:hypothetical protein